MSDSAKCKSLISFLRRSNGQGKRNKEEGGGGGGGRGRIEGIKGGEVRFILW